MSERTYLTDYRTLIKRLTAVTPVVSVAAAGAVTLQKRTFSAAGNGSVSPKTTLAAAPTTGVGYAVGDGVGTRSIMRNGPGDWTFTLSDSFQYLIGVEILGLSNTSGTNANAVSSVAINATTTNVNTYTSVGNGGVVRVVLFSGSTPTDPASGDTLTLRFTLGDGSEP